MKKLAAVLCIIFVFACVSAQSYKLSYYQEFDKNGNVTREIDSYGYEYEMKYDSHGNTIYCKGALDGETLAEGWLTYYIDGSIKTKTLRDDEGDVVYKYDRNGNVYYIGDSTGTAYNYYYDDLNRVIYASSSAGETVFFAYTDNGSYARFINADKTVNHYTYDMNGNLVSVRYSDGTVEDYTGYDDYDYDYDDYDDYDYDDYDYEDYDYDDYDYDDWYSALNDWYSEDDYDDDTFDDAYYEERDSYGNLTFIRTSYYSEKYEYTYYADGSIKSMACYEDESF